MKNKNIAAKTIHREMSADSTAHETEIKTQRRSFAIARAGLKSKSDTIAEDSFYYKNWGIKALREKYPENRELHHVDKMYPYSVHGELYFDEPTRPWDVEACKRKAKVMKEIGLKYAFIESEMGVEDIYEQLGLISTLGDAS